MVQPRPLLSAAFVAKARAIAVEHAAHCGTVVDLCDAYEAATERTERQRISHEIAAILHLSGALVARWLFFAQAEHVVGLYYGQGAR